METKKGRWIGVPGEGVCPGKTRFSLLGTAAAISRFVMNKTQTLITVGSGLFLNGFAQAELENEFHVGYNTDYIFRGADLGADAFEYGYDVSGEGYCDFIWSAGLWYITPQGQADDELDIYAALSKEIGFVTAEAGFTNYSYPGGGFDDDAEVYLGLSGEYAGLGLGAKAYYGTEGILESQFLGEVSAAYGFEFTDKLSGSASVTGGFILDEGDGGYTTDSGYVFTNVNLGLSYALAENISLNPYLAYTDADESVGDFSGVYGGATLSFAF